MIEPPSRTSALCWATVIDTSYKNTSAMKRTLSNVSFGLPEASEHGAKKGRHVSSDWRSRRAVTPRPEATSNSPALTLELTNCMNCSRVSHGVMVADGAMSSVL
ncbi:uncharacterized protein M421DRAFT_178943 [Didymella exigua CBS 183.55]|uniref:Uncharacterized protein n=1 Tax=Didymella exigua CBS 183.55 TaxID=1150837 RepID=A0A6A5RGH2_9PLEO|nr:uncharacterized protein M421DRAFT_178943 [Didymella exigua CBS 183.55]KAF1927411.1 hypothetical protein M421DRAFT_178943 [Didymella exigua CBS 183.55]